MLSGHLHSIRSWRRPCFLNNLSFGFWGLCTGSPRLIVTLEFKVAVAFLEDLQDQKFPGEVVTFDLGMGKWNK